MTGHHDDDLTTALHRLRRAVQQQVPVPDSGAVRAAATRALRVRRTAVGALAAAAVIAVAVGGAVVLQPSAAPPPLPPAESPTPTEREAPPTPSPRPTPGPVQSPPDDPIVEADWAHATIDVPPQEGCPSGTITFGPGREIDGPFAAYGPTDGFPRIILQASNAAYGDLTGDGDAEAVVSVHCAQSEEDSLDGQGQLLVVARTPDGDLTGLGWVGPRGAIYHDHWIAGGHLYLEAHPWHGETFAWMPGSVLRVSWDGTGFSSHEPASEYAPIQPIDEPAGPPVRLGAVAGGLGCSSVEVIKFDQAGTAQSDTTTYDVAQPGMPSSGPHVVDLDHTGQRLLMLAIACTQDGKTTRGLAVFERVEHEFQGISVLVPAEPLEISSWSIAVPPGGSEGWRRLLLRTFHGEGGQETDQWYGWDGTQFQPLELDWPSPGPSPETGG